MIRSLRFDLLMVRISSTILKQRQSEELNERHTEIHNKPFFLTYFPYTSRGCYHPPPRPRGNSNKKVTGKLVVRVRGVNFGFSVSFSV